MQADIKVYSLPLVLTASLLVSGANPAVLHAQTTPQPFVEGGCSPSSRENVNFVNNQIVRFFGGNCGGAITIKVLMSGTAQFPDAGSDPNRKSEVSIAIIREADGSDMCREQVKSRDQVFNSFNISCIFKNVVFANVTETYRISYKTNNISDKPLPILKVAVTYQP